MNRFRFHVSRYTLTALLAGVGAWTYAEPPWSVDDILLSESAGSFVVSPDGELAVWVKQRMDKDKGTAVSNLHLTDLASGESFPLTRARTTHSRPQWSPDGTHIAFFSTREPVKEEKDIEKRQIWLMRAAGGEPWMATRAKRPIRDYGWKDNNTLIVATPEDRAYIEQKIKEGKDTSTVVEDLELTPPVRLFSISIADGTVRRMTANDDWIDQIFVSPSGRWAVTRHQRSLSYDFDDKVKPVYRLLEFETGDWVDLLPDENVVPRSVSWEPDSGGVYLIADYSTHPVYNSASVAKVFYHSLDDGQTRQVDLDWERSLGQYRLYATDDGFFALLANGTRYQPALYRKRSREWDQQMIEGEHAAGIFNWALNPDGGTLVYEYSTAEKPPQWYAGRLRRTKISDPTQVTKLNPSFASKPVYKTEVIHWTGAEGDTIEGILYYPLDYEPGKRYPLITRIHGGPAGVDLDRWSQGWSRPKILLSQLDVFQLEVNYHGSASYGLAWEESIADGKYYSLPLRDIETGVDHVLATGMVDPDRIATMGWSNGSILSVGLVVQNPRYKAISAGAGDVEWVSDWGNVDFGAAFDNYYFGGSPWEKLETYIENSPFYKLDKVTAPTLIFFGTEDRNVPPSQGWSHFRALQQFGNTEVKFVLFPGEPHGLRKYVHQKRKVEEELAWFKTHLLGEKPEARAIVKPASPLDVALRLGEIPRVGDAFGEDVNGILVPEAISYKGLRVARFEVTRAQFAAFDSNHEVSEDTQNYPAHGVTGERAAEYAVWLSKQTGRSYRLPGEKEAGVLYTGGGSGNTLDYWAGYAPNPEDVEALLREAAKLPGPAPLLKPVGSFSGSGQNPVFDLGGNVAEWVEMSEGKYALRGGSADRPADDKSAPNLAGPGYRGFRVVLDAAQDE